MKNQILVLIGAMLLISSCKKDDQGRELPGDASKANQEFKFYPKAKNIPDHEKGVVLFKLKNNSSLSRVAGRSSAERVFTKAMEKAGDNGFYKSRFQDEIKALQELKKNSDVEWATLNYTEVTQTTPDDPYWTSGDLWGMLHIGANTAWQSGNFGNKQVVVGVIDEGIFGHDDLCQNIWNNPYEQDNGIDDDGNGYIDDFHGWDWFNNDNEVYPGASHGTHVAGTIGAKGGNQIGVIGVASNVTLISCKFLEGFGYDANAVLAIDYLIDLKNRHGINIKVTSNSWGGGGFNPALFEAIKRARDADILFVAAAGNSGTNNDTQPNFPCGYDVDNIISVGASDWQNNKASFSCFGATTVDIFAPGTGIISTVPNTSSHTSAYAYYSGTSMATPHVSGACALYAGINPEASYSQIKAAVLSAAKPVASLQGLCVTGGLLDVSTFTGQSQENQSPIYDCPVMTPDANPPTVPQNLDVYEVGFDPREGAFYGGYFGVRWDRSTDAESGIAGYIVYFNDVATWFVGGNNYVFAGFEDTTIDIVVKIYAQDLWGNVSGFSNSDTAIWNSTPTPPDTQAPLTPVGLFASDITTASIKLNWQASSDNVGVTGYKVNWRATGGSWLQIVTNSLSQTFNNLSEGTTYEFNVQARDAAGNWSPNSATLSASTLYPEPPPPACTINSSLNGTSNALQVTLSFSAASSCTISSTSLERKKGGSVFSTIANNPTSPYMDNVPNPGNYTYRLKVVLSSGQVGYSQEKIIKVSKK